MVQARLLFEEVKRRANEFQNFQVDTRHTSSRNEIIFFALFNRTV